MCVFQFSTLRSVHTFYTIAYTGARRGRAKVARIRANYKDKKREYHCSVCLQSGHNRRVCPNQPVEHGRAQMARDQLVVEGKY